MEKIIILIFDLGLFTIYILAGLIIASLIQLVSYRIFRFNLYKSLKYILIDREIER